MIQIKKILTGVPALSVLALLLLGPSFAATARAEDPVLDETDGSTRDAPSAGGWGALGTDLPLTVGGEAGVWVHGHFALSAGYGMTPEWYARQIGNAIDSFGGTKGYSDVVVGMFDKNGTWSAGLHYRFSGRTGWHVGTRFFHTSATGTAGISQVETITGTQFPVLKAFLAASGRSLIFSSDYSMSTLEIQGGYTWPLGGHWIADVSLGVAKVLSTSIELSSSAPAFDASNAGKNSYRQAQADLADALSKYGYAPVIGLKIGYTF